MKEQLPRDERLERLLDGALRDLPLRRAPESVETWVLEELRRRAALPWWRQSFGHWPALARSAFLLVCGGIVVMTVLSGAWVLAGMHSLTELGAMALAWAQPSLAVMASAGGLVSLLVHAIPSAWLYGALCVATLFYVALFGLGAAAYRTLYLEALE